MAREDQEAQWTAPMKPGDEVEVRHVSRSGDETWVPGIAHLVYSMHCVVRFPGARPSIVAVQNKHIRMRGPDEPELFERTVSSRRR